MSRRVIDRREWPAFLDAFSRRHEGWLISVAVEDGRGPRRYIARDVPLHGVMCDKHERTEAMVLFMGATAPHATHSVVGPASLAVSETADAAETEISITDDSGQRTIVELRTPTPTELVDGIA